MSDTPDDLERELIDLVGRFTLDPLGFAEIAFPWGNGELAGRELRDWQRETLGEVGRHVSGGGSVEGALQLATASGHGIGKSALVSIVIMWAMSTHPDTRGVVTANTEKQLTTKTWPELAKWHRLCITKHWFTYTATAIHAADPEHEKTWRMDAIPWSLNNTEAFAGLHNEGKRILVVFDEASAIPDQIWEVTEGALTDANTEIVWLAFGNPTRNTGRFRECFGRLRHRWVGRQIDSRTVDGTNKEQMAKWVEDYGEDSDFVRVRVRGVFPRAGVSQFIDSETVENAKARKLEMKDQGAAFVLGVDIARFGDDQSVIRGRQGRDGQSFKPIKWRGMDTVFSAGKVAEAIDKFQPDAVFIDGGGVGGGVVDILKSRSYRVVEINFGSTAKDENKYANKRAEMWGSARDWLKTGAIDSDPQFADDLVGPEYGFDKDGRILLEKKEDMKKRGLPSPDDADAFVLTFAQPVQRRDMPTSQIHNRGRVAAGVDYNPFGG